MVDRYHLSFIKSSSISKKLTTFRLALVVIDKPHSLNTWTIAFLFLSISDPERF